MKIFTKQIFLSIIFFFANETLLSQPAKVIDVTQQWTNTGIVLSDSQSVTIFAQGYATWNNFGNNQELRDWFTPSGLGGNYIDVNSTFPCPTCPAVSLIAKIGESSTPQFIGTSGNIGSYEGGTLYLGINDPIPEDNFGSFISLIFVNTTTSVKNESEFELANTYNLSQNYPNPFNPSTTIEYSVQTADNIQIKIYNSLGQLVRTLVNETKIPGEYSVVWNGKDDNGLLVASGAYFYQIQTENFVSNKKMILLK